MCASVSSGVHFSPAPIRIFYIQKRQGKYKGNHVDKTYFPNAGDDEMVCQSVIVMVAWDGTGVVYCMLLFCSDICHCFLAFWIGVSQPKPRTAHPSYNEEVDCEQSDINSYPLIGTSIISILVIRSHATLWNYRGHQKSQKCVMWSFV